MKKKKNNIIAKLFKVVFSRFTIATLAVLIQIFFLGVIFFCFRNYVVYYIGGMGVFSLILVVYILNKNMNSEFKTSWIILILCLPTIGGLFYLFCQFEPTVKSLKKKLFKLKEENRNYLVQEAKIVKELKEEDYVLYQFSKYLNTVGHFPVYKAVDVNYFKIGEEFYEDLLDKLKKAKKFIFLEFFIVANDSMWNGILDILKEKVLEGVEVRLLYDGTCSLVLLPRDYVEELKSFGIKAKQFSPIIPLISTHYNNRDHRKIVVIDGEYAYTGGCNLAEEYINKIVRFGHWKDNMIRFSGDAVNSFTTLFLEMWNLDQWKSTEDYTPYLANSSKDGEGFLIPFGDDPFDNEQIGKLTYMELLTTAKESVDIVMPYFVIDNEFLNVLIHVAKKGVRVRLILPGIADKKFVNFIAKSYYKELIANGIEIYEYQKGFTHLKVMLSDTTKCVVGTINLDYRSLYLHFEDAVLLYRVSEIAKIQKDYNELIQQSNKITKEEFKKISQIKIFLGKVFRIFGPLL